jgi:hypothetical protein
MNCHIILVPRWRKERRAVGNNLQPESAETSIQRQNLRTRWAVYLRLKIDHIYCVVTTVYNHFLMASL